MTMRAQGQATDRKLNKHLIIQLVDTRCSITYSIKKKNCKRMVWQRYTVRKKEFCTQFLFAHNLSQL